MTQLKEIHKDDLDAFHARIMSAYEEFRASRLNLNLTRGKPSPEQMDLSNELLRLPDNGDFLQADGGDTRNYYGSHQGLPEARALFSEMLGAPPDQIVIGNNSSLALMHDCIVYAMLKGLPNSSKPWVKDEPITFLCPTPGYDRHFAICEAYNIRMVAVPMTQSGPDMDKVERLVADPSVRGMWCVPKYSNPDGVVYSKDVVDRIAKMRTGAADFRVFWDNAYAVHHLTDVRHEVANILDACRAAENPDRALVFASTSKITFAGGGLSLFASSPLNVSWLVGCMSKRTIGPEKLNQLKHVRFLKNHAGILQLMGKHRKIIAPKFAAVESGLIRHLDGKGVATWTTPAGGYFISINLLMGSARRVVELAREAGLALVPAGASFPYGRDSSDSHLRIAPSFPNVEEVSAASDGIGLSILLSAIEEIRSNHSANA